MPLPLPVADFLEKTFVWLKGMISSLFGDTTVVLGGDGISYCRMGCTIGCLYYPF